jgi:hypothetical protein
MSPAGLRPEKDSVDEAQQQLKTTDLTFHALKEPNARSITGLPCSWGEINTGTCPSRLGEFQHFRQ